MRMFAVVLASSSLVLAACQTPAPPAPPHTAFDASQFPPGDGWFCYEANEGVAPAPCERVKADCDAQRKKDVNAKSDCVKRDVAYCFTVTDPPKSSKACFDQQRECTNASNVKRSSGTPSDCGAVK